MPALPTLPNRESYSTKDIMLTLSRAILNDQGNIPKEYINLHTKKDCAYARTRQKTKHPDNLLVALIKASTLISNINKNPKTKIEYKLYLEQLEASSKKADEQLAKLKALDKKLDDLLPVWLEKHRTNSHNLTRPGVTMESATMTTAMDNTFKEINQLLEEYQQISQAAETATTGLSNVITSTEAVVPQQMVKEAAIQAASMKEPNLYEEQQQNLRGQENK